MPLVFIKAKQREKKSKLENEEPSALRFVAPARTLID
jgi:hypothetical protein